MSSTINTPITIRYPALIEAFEFIKGEYTWAKLSWCSETAYQLPASKDLSTATVASEAANTELNWTPGAKLTVREPCTCTTCTKNKWALALDELYTALFPEESL